MKKIYLILFSLLLVHNIWVWGQGTVFFKASRNEQMNHFVDASRSFQGLYLRGDREASLQAARNLYKARRYEEALPLYEFADSIKIISDAEQVFAFFECLKSVKRYEEADLLVKSRLGEFAERPEFGIHHEKMEFYVSILAYKGADLKLIEMNTEFSEISPTVYNGWLYFASTRPATGNHTVHRINMQPFYNLYGAPVEGTGPEVADPRGVFGEAPEKITIGSYETMSIPEGINKKFHDGPINITPSGKYMFFTSNQFEGKKAREVINLMIWYSENKDGVWQVPQPLPSNSSAYSNQHGYFDQATATLYFASNRPGGKGGWDIWKSRMEANGSWAEPENLGSGVNTVKTEVFPSLSPDGTLIFASNGWPGLGGLDLFLWQPGGDPLNLLAGINSEKDDFGMLFMGKEGGYMVSNRSGGAGDDDIWSFRMKYDVSEIRKFNRYSVPVMFTLKDIGTGAKIGSAQAVIARDGKLFTLKDGDTLGLMSGDVITLQADGFKRLILNATASILDEGKAIAGFEAVEPLVLKKDEVASATETVVPALPASDQKSILYFNFDKSDLRKDASEPLAKVVFVMLEEYEASEVLLSGHTDTRGSNVYNEQLSKNRVNAVKQWLVERGVDPKRIKTQAFGESRLAVGCTNPLHRVHNLDSCLTDADHRLNRRVEIDIMPMTKD